MSEFYLTGDFNGWSPGDPRWRFEEVRAPYGQDEWGEDHRGWVGTDAYSLTAELPAGRARFKVLEGRGWARQWSTQAFHGVEQSFEAFAFRPRTAPKQGVLVPRGGGQPPHAEVTLPGGRVRFDFCPRARTLAVHTDLGRAPGPRVRRWKEFACGTDAVFDTWVVTPYGAKIDEPLQLALVFDGRSMVYGEDPRWGVYDDEARQFFRPLDTLIRHGVVGPTAWVGVEVPRRPSQQTGRERRGRHDRQEALATDSGLRQAYVTALRERVLPALGEAFGVQEEGVCVVGHSWGGDFALHVAGEWADIVDGVLAMSPADPVPGCQRLGEVARATTRVAVTYGLDDLGPFFLTRAAKTRAVLAGAGLPHLVQMQPSATHDPASLAEVLPGALGFVLG